jgi:hypothetical protein
MRLIYFALFGTVFSIIFININVRAQGSSALTVFVSSTLKVNANPVWVVAADVNGDGKPDLICANIGVYPSDGTMTIFTNNGTGDFGFEHMIAGIAPEMFAAADVNGDGKPDLIGVGGPELLILTNNGSGSFGSNATYFIGNPPTAPDFVTTADVNGDSNLDLIVAITKGPSTPGTLMVLTNNGSGIFGSNATYTVGEIPVCVTTADINGDGKPDLICANHYSGTLTMLTNDGSGLFVSNATLNVGFDVNYVVAADVNGDGKPDLVCANLGPTLTVWTNNGCGVFGSNATYSVGAVGPRCVVAADVNGDGKVDLICVSDTSSSPLTVLTNNGTGGFGLYATLGVGHFPGCVVAADVSGNGRPSLITANAGFETSGEEYGSLTILSQVNVAPPLLNIMPTGINTLTLSWSSFFPGFALETNTDLTTTNWGPANYTILTNSGTNESATITSSPSGKLFFRLNSN